MKLQHTCRWDSERGRICQDTCPLCTPQPIRFTASKIKKSNETLEVNGISFWTIISASFSGYNWPQQINPNEIHPKFIRTVKRFLDKGEIECTFTYEGDGDLGMLAVIETETHSLSRKVY